MRYLLSLSVACALALSACGKSDPPVRRYHTRGVVTVASLDADGLSVAVHHEAIPDFEDRDGKRTRMSSMTMLFGVAKDVPQSLFKQGAKLALDFDVRWSKLPTLFIVKAAPLEPDAPLKLEESH
jgi:Cu/Ag efflux protein CusF